jgi:hypothetical protein
MSGMAAVLIANGVIMELVVVVIRTVLLQIKGSSRVEEVSEDEE